MVAVRAHFDGAKICLASMTLPVDTLTYLLVNQIMAPSAARNGDAISEIALSFLVTDLRSKFGLLLLFRFLDRVASAFLAFLVCTFDTLLL